MPTARPPAAHAISARAAGFARACATATGCVASSAAWIARPNVAIASLTPSTAALLRARSAISSAAAAFPRASACASSATISSYVAIAAAAAAPSTTVWPPSPASPASAAPKPSRGGREEGRRLRLAVDRVLAIEAVRRVVSAQRQVTGKPESFADRPLRPPDVKQGAGTQPCEGEALSGRAP
eukprot:4523963-Prymnesium_polylepis.2